MNDFSPCDEVKEMLSPYYDGELDIKDTKIVQKHVKECLNCRRELEDIKKLSGLIKSAYAASPLKARKKQVSLKKLVTPSIAALILVAFIGWFSISFMNTEKTSTIQTDKPMYVQAEDYFLADIYSEP